MEDDRPVSSEGVLPFTRKSVFDHVGGVLGRWRVMLLTALAVFGVMWTMAESASYFLRVDLSGSDRLVTVLIFSLIAALVWAVYQYVGDAPRGMEHESPVARRLAQLQPAKWEVSLARQLLHDLLDDFDGELQSAREGRVFVPISTRLSPSEYADWAQRRLANLRRMMEVGTRLLVLDFIGALMLPYSDDKASHIRSVVYRVRDFYAATVEFELDRHAVEPPDGAERLHELQADWSNPIRDAVQQLFDIVEQVIAVDLKSETQLSLSITMDSPPNVDEYCAEIERLERSGTFGWSS